MTRFAGFNPQGSGWEFDTPTFQPVRLRSVGSTSSSQEGDVQPMFGGIDRDSSELLGSSPRLNSAAKSRMAGSTLTAIGEVGAAQKQADAMEAAARARSQGSTIGGILSAVGTIGGAALALCDERYKVDIAPLSSAPANDRLGELACAVKELRECS